ncbi:hypothetical protein BH10ACI3_BH10ACI3_04750 [soil metagenome]
MKCGECNNLIGAFLDNELEAAKATAVRDHLSVCDPCAKVCEDIASIVYACKEESADDLVPPNSRALWLRINNVIENEPKVESVHVETPKRRFWQLSIMQIAAALICIAVISSLLTIVAVRNYSVPADGDFVTRGVATQTTFEKVLSRVGLTETPAQARERRLNEQHAAIEYWNARVQTRRMQWDRATRDAFDRNLQVIDESVNEYTYTLQQDPEDDLSGEMLDSVLNDKMNLLRDFADL